MIPLSRPFLDYREEEAVLRVLRSGRIGGNGAECHFLESELRGVLEAEHVLAVSTCSHALEITMELLDLDGGEVILPSFTFPSVANSVIRAGGKPVFCEIREPDLNLDLDHAKSLMRPQTKAVVVTHYGGNPVDFSSLPGQVVEDAAHTLGSRINRSPCGTTGRFGCLSFDHAKNVTGGEGGALICHTESDAERAKIVREKGTNRDAHLKGKATFYNWIGSGSNYVLPEVAAAMVSVQIQKLDRITAERRRIAGLYDEFLQEDEHEGRLKIVRPVGEVVPNHHIYAILVDPRHRQDLIADLREAGIQAASHYEPLHSAPMGQQIGPFTTLPNTDRLAASVIRLPIYPGLRDQDVHRVAAALKSGLKKNVSGIVAMSARDKSA